MIIGVDFDNTLVSYAGVFYKVARELELIPESCGKTKNEVRDYLRGQGQEAKWTELQGIVYGSRMNEALPFPGVINFFEQIQARNIPVYIISHKTEFAKKGVKYNLHQAALGWLEENGFFAETGINMARERVFFNAARLTKIDKIKECGCTHFIDDLPEVFDEPQFPENVEKILFNSLLKESVSKALKFDSWTKIAEYFNAK